MSTYIEILQLCLNTRVKWYVPDPIRGRDLGMYCKYGYKVQSSSLTLVAYVYGLCGFAAYRPYPAQAVVEARSYVAAGV